ncbi:MAG: RNA polymerase subunit sigma-70 [Planctomycetota bacterium]|nr:MAG: RNA polymerase subunit sigma-70 [Planctomycetota bacterium]
MDRHERLESRERQGAARTQLEVWLDDARAGSDEALGALLEGCRKYLLLMASRELDSDLRPRTAASDLVQETCVEVHRSFQGFRGNTEDELFGWLRAILSNRLATNVRRHRYTLKRTVDREQPLDLAPVAMCLGNHDDPTPSDRAARHDEDRRLQDALNQLNELDRKLIVMHTWEQQTFTEIGRRLGKSADATRRAWGRAVKRLERKLRSTR